MARQPKARGRIGTRPQSKCFASGTPNKHAAPHDDSELKKERRRVYDMPYVLVGSVAPTAAASVLADRLFDKWLRTAAGFKCSKVPEKRVYFRSVFSAVQAAMHRDGCVAYPRNHNSPDCTKARLQVIDCFVATGLVADCRSPKGSPKMSRLRPTPLLHEFAMTDPWEFDRNRGSPAYVFLTDRESGDDRIFDRDAPTPAYYQKRLERINESNSLYEITYRKFDRWDDSFTARRRLRPVHYARFTNDFDHHGRLYTDRYGHQSLSKSERSTIWFDGRQSVELDFSGMHPRLLYHLEGIDFRGDPYKLWGDATTPQQRRMVKVLFNALINATLLC